MHQRADAIDAVDSVEMFGEAGVIGRGLVAELEHVAEDGDAAALCHGPRLQAVEGGDHAGGVTVKAVVDQGGAADRLLDAAAGHDADLVEFWRERRGIEAGGVDGGERRERVLQAMRRAGRQAQS